MKILFLAPLYDRVNGMSLASEVFLAWLTDKHQVSIVNLKKRTRKSKFLTQFFRVFEVFLICLKVIIRKRGCDTVYFTISESYFGNFKDILIMMICRKLLPHAVIHLHGGEGMKNILLGKHRFLKKLNLYFLNKVGAIVVLGKTHVDLYQQVKNKEKIVIIPNFAKDSIFSSREKIEKKFSDLLPLKILLVSNFLEGKGQRELLEAFSLLDEADKKRVQINFAGEIMNDEQRQSLDSVMKTYSQVRYHGIVSGHEKIKLFNESHVFCMPTYYASEGQPIVLLEAFASGNVVFVTRHSGIFDIFEPGKNGVEITKKSANSIKTEIVKVLNQPGDLLSMALQNFDDAKTYYTEIKYNQKLSALLDAVKAGTQ